MIYRVFRSLWIGNYRLWAGGALLSNIGTWMQRTAQDWLVLAELTHNNATAVGIVIALQFGPQLLLLPVTGYAADRLDRRKLLLATQFLMGSLALGLGLLTLSERVQLWHVYLFAFLLGCVAAFDAPARQAFVCDLVGEADLSNAIALNSTSFNAARMIGPAVAGILIAQIGTGWVFLLNAVSFLAVLFSLMAIHKNELFRYEGPLGDDGGFLEGFRYVWHRPDLVAVLTMFFLIGTFALNFPIFISTMTVQVFHAGAEEYGLLTSTMAIGSVGGTLLAAAQPQPSMAILFSGAAAIGASFAMASTMPGPTGFGLALVLLGLSVQSFTATANSAIQLATDPIMRGRVMAILMAVALGGTPLGAPAVGWVADTFGPRQSMGVGIAAGILAALVGVRYLIVYRGLKLTLQGSRPTLTLAPPPTLAPGEHRIGIG